MKKPVDLKALVSDFLKPALTVAKKHGGKTRLAQKLSGFLGKPVPRQSVQKWTGENPASRREPTLSTGLLLVHAANEIEVESKPKTKKNK